VRLVQFTGSTHVAEIISKTMDGAVRLEDAGFDWKVIGPDYDEAWLDYVAWQADEDAYNAAGQKCSAQSILLVHDNWADALLPKLGELAARRSLENLTNGPVLTWTNEQIQDHVDATLAVPGAELLFGGSPLTGHEIPPRYGAYEPTAVRVPLEALPGRSARGTGTHLASSDGGCRQRRPRVPEQGARCDGERDDLLRHARSHYRRTAKSLVRSLR
jgi:1-pyrroline-5-carboxylate dehydrogenase